MSYRDLPEDLLLQVRPFEVRRYAVAEGWRRVEGVNGTIALYQHPESDLDQLIVPLDPSMDDYGRGTADIIARLAERSGLSPIQVLEDLLNSPCDVLRFRLDEPDSQRGTIPLVQGIGLLAAAERALLSSACSVIQPQAFHPRLSRGEAEQLVRACRMAQTERGSFVLKVACPLDAVDPDLSTSEPMPLFDKVSEPETDSPMNGVREPFTRQVTRLLMGSLNRITKAIDGDKTASLLIAEAGQPVLSANLCEAVLGMEPIGERSRLVIQTSWSKAFAPPSESATPSLVSLRSDVFREIEKVARELRPSKEPKVSNFVGLVDSLLGDPDPEGRVQGDVILMLFDVEGAVKARATLDAGNYQVAWQAHGAARYVTLSGMLIRERRTHRLQKISHFKLLANE
jgi:hypothetical protein